MLCAQVHKLLDPLVLGLTFPPTPPKNSPPNLPEVSEKCNSRYLFLIFAIWGTDRVRNSKTYVILRSLVLHVGSLLLAVVCFGCVRALVLYS